MTMKTIVRTIKHEEHYDTENHKHDEILWKLWNNVTQMNMNKLMRKVKIDEHVENEENDNNAVNDESEDNYDNHVKYELDEHDKNMRNNY